MTRAHKLRTGVIVVTVLAAVPVSVLLITQRPQPRPLSLLFEQYGRVTTMDFDVEKVGFFWLTNLSDKTYYFSLGGTNTYLRDELVGFGEGSYMARCEFRDQTPPGSTSPMPPVSFASLGKCMPLGPHSAVRLRVALPPEGQKRKVAVLCAEPLPGLRPFWTSSIGAIIIRALPRSVARKAMDRTPPVPRIWCDRELSDGREKLEKR